MVTSPITSKKAFRETYNILTPFFFYSFYDRVLLRVSLSVALNNHLF